MSLGDELFARLTAAPAVSALVGTRVFPSELPQEEAVPALVYSVVYDRPESTLTGVAAELLRAARVQVDAYARTYTAAKALEAAVTSALADLSEPSPGLSVVQDSARDLFDHETRFHRVLMEFTVWR